MAFNWIVRGRRRLLEELLGDGGLLLRFLLLLPRPDETVIGVNASHTYYAYSKNGSLQTWKPWRCDPSASKRTDGRRCSFWRRPPSAVLKFCLKFQISAGPEKTKWQWTFFFLDCWNAVLHNTGQCSKETKHGSTCNTVYTPYCCGMYYWRWCFVIDGLKRQCVQSMRNHTHRSSSRNVGCSKPAVYM